MLEPIPAVSGWGQGTPWTSHQLITSLILIMTMLIYSYNRNLYWTDWNRDAPKIETSYMDGSNRRVLVKDDLGLPNGLTFDSQSSMLCWADAGAVDFLKQMSHPWTHVCRVISNKWNFLPLGTHKMECMHPARGDRRKVAEGIQYPFGITSFGKNIYYTDWQRFDVLFYHQVQLLVFYTLMEFVWLEFMTSKTYFRLYTM